MKPFTDEEVNALFHKMFPASTLNRAQCDWIRELADGRPTLLQNACVLLWRIRHEGSNLESWQFADDRFRQTPYIFEYEWRTSQKREQLAMLLIARVGADGRVRGRNFDLSGLDTCVTALVK